MSHRGTDHNGGPGAFDVCHQFVEQRLTSPASAESAGVVLPPQLQGLLDGSRAQQHRDGEAEREEGPRP